MNLSYQIIAFMIAVFLLPVHGASATHEVLETLHTQVIKALDHWEANEAKKQKLADTLQTLDIHNDPERDDRLWWNPLWRVSRENQVQQANDITLEIQKINEEQLKNEAALLDSTKRYCETALALNTQLSEEQTHAWIRADHWRLPRLLAPPDWDQYRAAQLNQQPAELRNKRMAQLAQKRQTWRQLEVYLGSVIALHEQSKDEADRFKSWQAELDKQLRRLDSLDLPVPR